jgi:hypothetical protein
MAGAAKLHAMLTRRGVTLSVAALGTVLAGEAVTAAPAGLAASIAGAGLASAVGTAGLPLNVFKAMSTTKLKFSVSALAVVAAATALIVQHRSQTRLREENRSFQRQVDHDAKLGEENQRLSNLVAQASGRQSLPQEQMRELLRLRGEVGRLRQENKEMKKFREEIRQTQLTPGVGAELRIARQKLSDLRDLYGDQHPDVQAQLRAIESLERSGTTPGETLELAKAKEELARMQVLYGDEHPDVRAQLRAIESLERSAAASEPPELAQAKAELAKLQVSYGDAHPAVQSQLRKIAELER